MFNFYTRILLVICNLHCLQNVDGAKILAIPIPFHSHVAESNAVVVELNKRGHQTTFYLPDNFDSSKSAPDIPSIRYGQNAMSLVNAHANNAIKLSAEGKFSFRHMHGVRTAICTHLMNDTKALEKLRRENFDFAIIDYMFITKCPFLIPYNLSIPFAGIGTVILSLDAGQPITTSISPFLFTTYTPNMAFYERVINTLLHLVSAVSMDFFLESYDYSKIAPDLSWKELQNLPKKAEIFLENSDILLSYPKPRMPNVIQVGGLTVKPAKPLSRNIRKFFDDASDGVIIVSFGSVFKLNDHIKNIFISVFQKLKQRVLWKTDQEKEIGNVLLSKWLPQNDALGHPNTRLLIYHCGNNGMFESLYHGVPLICIPMGADQFTNSRKLGYFKTGRFFDIADLTEELLQECIHDVLSNPKYTVNIKHLSEIYRSRSETATERAASAIEHVIKYGGKHLRLNGVDLSILQLLAIDVWLFVFVLLFVFIKLIVYTFSFCKRIVQLKTKIKQN